MKRNSLLRCRNKRDKHCDVGRQEKSQSGGKRQCGVANAYHFQPAGARPTQPQLPIASSMQSGWEQQATSVNGVTQERFDYEQFQSETSTNTLDNIPNALGLGGMESPHCEGARCLSISKSREAIDFGSETRANLREI